MAKTTKTSASKKPTAKKSSSSNSQSKETLTALKRRLAESEKKTRRLLKETEERNAELAIINSVQEALVAKLDIQAMYDLLGEKIRSLFDAQVVLIAGFDLEKQFEHFYYVIEKGERFTVPPRPMDVMRKHIVKTRQALLINENFPKRVAELGGRPNVVPGTEQPKSLLFVPLIVGNKVSGYISLQNIDHELAFRASDVSLLTTLANSMSVALESARLFDETQLLFKAEQQRAAELTVISNIQQGLAAELNFQAIIDLVGDKLREELKTGDIGIRWYDEKANMVHYLYEFEHGKRISIPSAPPRNNMWKEMMKTRKPIVLNSRAEMEAFGATLVPGTDQSYSMATAPIIGRDRMLGSIIIENYEIENAYSASDVRLLQTVASSMGVALENARLFDETQRLFQAESQRAAELQIINGIQEVLASKLDVQEIYSLVGEHITKLFNAQTLFIMTLDPQTNMEHYPYMVERGKRQYQESLPHDENGFSPLVMRTRKPIVINEDMIERSKEVGSIILGDGERSKSGIWVPIIIRGEAIGVLSVQNIDVENSFSETDVSLLTTIANSMSAAIENAGLFEETQRLLKETAQRAEELQIVNSVQAMLDSRSDMQSIYDHVGDKVREIFDAQTVVLTIYDKETNLTYYPYIIEKGERLHQTPLPLDEHSGGFGGHVIRTRKPLVVNRNFEEESIKYNSRNLGEDADQDTVVLSGVWVPLIVGDEVKGVLSLQNLEREDAFSNSDVRLLSALANSMSAALENVRLFNETQRLLKETEQRASELTIINRVLTGLDSRGELQGIYDLVGDKLNEIFATHTTVLMLYDRKANTLSFPFIMERGVRLHQEPIPFPEEGGGFSAHVIRTGEPIMINENFAEEARKVQSVLLGESKDKGVAVRSGIWAPLMLGDEAQGVISLQNLESEHAFKESDKRLLSTIANSLVITIENARLFDETQRLLKETEQRASELSIINSVQKSLVTKLDLQAIIELIGEKIWQIFDSQVVVISLYDAKEKTIDHRYIIERGERIYLERPLPVDGMRKHVIKMRQTWLINEDFRKAAEQLETSYKVVGEEPKSLLFVPLIVGEEVTGVISLQNLDREHAFAASDVHLLQTIANGMSVAIENARLFDETNRRARETAVLNEVGRDVSSTLDLSAVMEKIASHARDLLSATASAIYLPDESGRKFRAIVAKGKIVDEILADTITAGEGIIGTLAQEGRSEFINDTNNDPRTVQIPGTEMVSQERLMVAPLLSAEKVIGMMAIWREGGNPFDLADLYFLEELSLQAVIAIKNARLFEDAKEARRAAEDANQAKSAFLANMSHELRTPLNAIIGFTRIVRRKADGALPDKQLENLDKVLSSGEHLLNLINTVLDIAKIEAGRMEVQASNFNLEALGDQCLQTAQPLIKPGVRLEKDYDEGQLLVYTDQDKVKQIILNLLSNAAKFTHTGRVRLSVHREGAMIKVAVSDTGIGINKEALDRIFEEFQQADTSTTRQYGGTGLGLSISRSLARLLGGDLTAVSEPGRGATFTLLVPNHFGDAAASLPEPARGQTKEAASVHQPGGRNLVLVIDDDPDAVYLLQESLSHAYEIVGAHGGVEGQKRARELHPRAILLDIMLPDKDGWQVLHDLKQDARTADIPVILLTIVDKKALGFRLGASAYLLKPLDPEEVMAALRRVTEQEGRPARHVLVVDDDPHVADMLKQILPEGDFALDSAPDGVAGLEAIAQRRPDVLLLDLMMPRLDGFGVIESLRQDPETQDLPIIVISAKELTSEESTRLKESAAYVMRKQGFDSERLLSEINKALETNK